MVYKPKVKEYEQQINQLVYKFRTTASCILKLWRTKNETGQNE